MEESACLTLNGDLLNICRDYLADFVDPRVSGPKCFLGSENCMSGTETKSSAIAKFRAIHCLGPEPKGWKSRCIVAVPLLVVIAEQAPGRSKAEMEALATLPQVEIQRLPGSLGLHEEYAEQLRPALASAPVCGNEHDMTNA